VQTLLSTWRDEAQQIAKNALDRLPLELKQSHLDSKLAAEMAVPLNAFAATLNAEIDPARVAALPARARRLIDDLSAAIRAEVQKQSPRPPEDAAHAPTARGRGVDALLISRPSVTSAMKANGRHS
jgi:hypothetical protein